MAGRCWCDELLQSLHHRLPAAAEFDLLHLARLVQHAGRHGLLHRQRVEHPVLDRVLGDEVDDRDGLGLILAPGAGDALFKLGRIPRQVAVDDHAGGLEVQPGRAGVGAEKDAAFWVILEGVDLGAAALLRDAAGVPGVTDVVLVAMVTHELKHPFPFR